MSDASKEVADIDMRCRNYKCKNWGTAYKDFCSLYEKDSFLYCENFKRKNYFKEIKNV